MKRLALVITFIVFFISMCGTAFAGGTQGPAAERDLDWYISGSEADFPEDDNPLAETESFLVSVTNLEHEGNATLFFNTKTFPLYGFIKEPGVKVILAVFNGLEYEEIRFSEEQRGLPVSDVGLFAEDIELTQGINKFKVVAYTNAAEKNPEPGVNLQIKYITVKYYPPGYKAQSKSGDWNFTDMLQQINKSLIGR